MPVEDAIQNYQGFGTLKLGISSEFNIFVTQGTSSHNFEMGILPLLLERKNHIVKRLSALGGNPVEAEKAVLQETVSQLRKTVRRRESLARLSFGALGWVVVAVATLYLPHFLDWQWFVQHPNNARLTMLFLLVAAGLLWSILDDRTERRWVAFGSVVLAGIVAVVTVL